MARCILCSRTVGDFDVTCPTCGGAVEDAPPATSVWEVPGPPSPVGPPGGPVVAPPPGYGPPAGYGPPSSYGPSPYGPPGYGPPAYGPPGYGYGYGAGYPGYAAALPTDGLAVASLIVSVAGLVTAFVLYVTILACPVGAVMGHMAMRRIDRERRTSGRGLALAGVIVGWIGTGFLVLGVAAVVLLIWAFAGGA